MRILDERDLMLWPQMLPLNISSLFCSMFARQEAEMRCGVVIRTLKRSFYRCTKIFVLRLKEVRAWICVSAFSKTLSTNSAIRGVKFGFVVLVPWVAFVVIKELEERIKELTAKQDDNKAKISSLEAEKVLLKDLLEDNPLVKSLQADLTKVTDKYGELIHVLQFYCGLCDEGTVTYLFVHAKKAKNCIGLCVGCAKRFSEKKAFAKDGEHDEETVFVLLCPFCDEEVLQMEPFEAPDLEESKRRMNF